MTQVFHRSWKKISHKEVLDLTNDQKTVHREKTLNKIHLPYIFGPSVTPKQHKQKTPDAETGENRSFPRQLQGGVEHNLRWCQSSSAEQPTKYTRHTAMTQVFHRSRKKISQGSIGPYNTPKQLWTGKKIEQKSSLSIMFDPCVIPKDHKQKTADADTGENRSFPHPLQRGVEHVLRLCECSSAKQPTVYTRLAAMTQVFHRSKKKYLTRKHWILQHAKTTLNRWKKGTKKVAFQSCSTHVLFPKVTSKKRQMQRQERTGHYHVHSKEEWNMFYDGVNNRVQSNRQFTQDFRQWHKSSIEAEKNISQVSIVPYNSPKHL